MCPVILRQGEEQASSNLCLQSAQQWDSGIRGDPMGEGLCYKAPSHESDRVVLQLQTGLVCSNSFVNTVEPPPPGSAALGWAWGGIRNPGYKEKLVCCVNLRLQIDKRQTRGAQWPDARQDMPSSCFSADAATREAKISYHGWQSHQQTDGLRKKSTQEVKW